MMNLGQIRRIFGAEQASPAQGTKADFHFPTPVVVQKFGIVCVVGIDAGAELSAQTVGFVGGVSRTWNPYETLLTPAMLAGSVAFARAKESPEIIEGTTKTGYGPANVVPVSGIVSLTWDTALVGTALPFVEVRHIGFNPKDARWWTERAIQSEA